MRQNCRNHKYHLVHCTDTAVIIVLNNFIRYLCIRLFKNNLFCLLAFEQFVKAV